MESEVLFRKKNLFTHHASKSRRHKPKSSQPNLSRGHGSRKQLGQVDIQGYATTNSFPKKLVRVESSDCPRILLSDGNE